MHPSAVPIRIASRACGSERAGTRSAPVSRTSSPTERSPHSTATSNPDRGRCSGGTGSTPQTGASRSSVRSRRSVTDAIRSPSPTVGFDVIGRSKAEPRRAGRSHAACEADGLAIMAHGSDRRHRMAYEQLIVDRDGAVATVRLNNPAKLNALSETMTHELIDALTTLRDDPGVRAVVLTGEGRGFCSG